MQDANEQNFVVNPQRSKPYPTRPEPEPQPVTFTPLQQAVIDHLLHDHLTISQTAKALNRDISQISRIVHLPKVQDELLRGVAQHRGIAAILGLRTVMKLAQEGRSEYVQLEAAKDLLDRAGFKAPDVHHVEGEVSIVIDLS
jgi:hypothetical protein